MGCVKSWFINCTGSISIESPGDEMSKELHLYLFGKCPTIVIAGRGL